jgi:hypothetical protein
MALIGSIGTVGLALAPAAAADVVEEYVRGYCSPPNGQDCNARPSIHFDAHIAEKVLASFTNDANGCSDIVVRFSSMAARSPHPRSRDRATRSLPRLPTPKQRAATT